MGSQIQVIDRAVSLLRELGAERAPQRLTDLAKRAELNLSTTRRILAALVENGLVEQVAPGSYRLGLTVFELGRQAEKAMGLRELARPFLAELTTDSKLTSMLGVRHDGNVVCIERVDGQYATTLALTIGASLPLHAGGAGKALLYWSGDEVIREYFDRHAPLHRYTPATITELEPLLADATVTRGRRWVETVEDVTPGVAVLAMPVLGPGGGDPVAAVSISGLVPHVLGDAREANIAELRAAVESISSALGWRA